MRWTAIIDGLNAGRSATWARTIIAPIGDWNNLFWPFIVIGETPMMTIDAGWRRERQ